MPILEWEGAPYVHRPSPHLLTPHSLELERTLREVRLPLAVEYARLNDLNRIVVAAPGARVGVVAAGVAAWGYASGISLGDGSFYGRRAGRAAAKN